MKKLVAVLTAFFASAMLFAFDLSIGVRTGVDINLFDVRVGDFKADMKPAAGFGVNVLANIGLPVKGLYLQPEIGYHYRNISAKFANRDADSDYMTLDVPILIAYKFPLNKYVYIQPALGPKFSAMLNEMNGDWDYGVNSYFNFGAEVGATVGINAGPGAVLVDFRYSNDFTKIKIDGTIDDTVNKREVTDWELGCTRAVYISVGYQFKIK